MRSLVLVVALLVSAGGVCAQDMLGVSWSGSVYTIGLSGSGSFLGASGFPNLNSLARSSDGTFYSASANNLVTIDPATGMGTLAVTLPASLGDIRGLAFGEGDTLYAILNGTPDALWILDPLGGPSTLVGNTGSDSFQGLVYDFENGMLLGWAVQGSPGAGLMTIDPATGGTVDVNPSFGTGVDIQGLAFAPDGQLYGVRDSTYTIDPATGIPLLVGTGGYVDVRGFEFLEGGPPPGPTFIRGDADGDGSFTGLVDGLFILNFQFIPGSPAPPCLDAADADDNGSVTGLVDGLYLLTFQFVAGSPPPPDPGPLACGVDPSDDGLDCGVPCP